MRIVSSFSARKLKCPSSAWLGLDTSQLGSARAAKFQLGLITRLAQRGLNSLVLSDQLHTFLGQKQDYIRTNFMAENTFKIQKLSFSMQDFLKNNFCHRSQQVYRLIIFRKSLFFIFLSENLTNCELLFEFFDESVNKRNFLKISNLYIFNCRIYCIIYGLSVLLKMINLPTLH